MNPKYCISLDLAKRLKELGVKQKSEYYWSYIESMCVDKNRGSEDGHYVITRTGTASDCSAFLVGELGEMLPLTCYSHTFENKATWKYGKWACKNNAKDYFYTQRADNEAEARGLMLEYLYKEGLIKGGGE